MGANFVLGALQCACLFDREFTQPSRHVVLCQVPSSSLKCLHVCICCRTGGETVFPLSVNESTPQQQQHLSGESQLEGI